MQSIAEKVFYPLSVLSLMEDMVFITHAVPAARVRHRLPQSLQLETFHSHGKERALISVVSFIHRSLRPLKFPQHFSQMTFRTYVRQRNRRGVYFFGTIMDSMPAFLMHRCAARHAALGKHSETKHTGGEGYVHLGRRMQSTAFGETRFEVQAESRPHRVAPFTDGEDLTQFLTYRQHGFMVAPGGWLFDQQVSHVRMTPLAGVLRSGRFDLWQRLGILRPEENLETHSILVQPRSEFRVYPPIPRLWMPLTRRHPDGLETRIEKQQFRKAA